MTAEEGAAGATREGPAVGPARLLAREETALSPWVRLVRREVRFAPGERIETYHAFAQRDYVGILARTPSGLIPLVRQYRPAIDRYTCEFPGGMLEPGEDPEACCRRELREEAGLEALRVTYLGAYFADTGRLENRHHGFFVEASEQDPAFVPEPHVAPELVTYDELRARILSGAFSAQLHLGLLTLRELRLGGGRWA